MTTCLGESCSFGSLCMSFVNVYQFVCVCVCVSFSFGFEGRIRDLIVHVLIHYILCYSINFMCRQGGRGRFLVNVTINQCTTSHSKFLKKLDSFNILYTQYN